MNGSGFFDRLGRVFRDEGKGAIAWGWMETSNADTGERGDPSFWPKWLNDCEGWEDRGVVRGVSGGEGTPEEGDEWSTSSSMSSGSKPPWW